MYAFPLILVVTHYILWFESLLMLNNPVSNTFLMYNKLINLYIYVKLILSTFSLLIYVKINIRNDYRSIIRYTRYTKNQNISLQ